MVESGLQASEISPTYGAERERHYQSGSQQVFAMLCGVSQGVQRGGYGGIITGGAECVPAKQFARYAPSRCRSQVHRFRLRDPVCTC